MIRVNDTVVDFRTFPNGETYTDSGFGPRPNKMNDVVIFEYETDADFLHLFMVKSKLDEHYPDNKFILAIPYMPYSRMDRQENNRMYTLRYVADLINSMNFSKVIIQEPHSDITCALIKNSVAVNTTMKLFDFVTRKSMNLIDFDFKEDYVVYPDMGAHKSYSKQMNPDNYAIGIKTRDFNTGRIINYDMHTYTNSSDKYISIEPCVESELPNVVIVDDLCSKGGTFIYALDELAKKIDYNKAYLIVAHCEETMLEGEVLSRFDHVITTNSIIDTSKARDYNNLTIIDYSNYIFNDV